MPIGGKNIHMNYCINNLVNQSVLLGNTTTPQCTSATLKWFRFACSCLWMVVKFCNECKSLLVGFWFTLTQYLRSC